MKIIFKFDNKTLNIHQLVKGFGEVEKILFVIDRQIVEEISKKLELSEMTRDTIYERIRKYDGERLQLINIYEGSFYFECVFTAVGYYAVKSVIGECCREEWERVKKHEKLTEIFKEIFNDSDFLKKTFAYFKRLEKIFKRNLRIYIKPGSKGQPPTILIYIKTEESKIPTISRILAAESESETENIQALNRFLATESETEKENIQAFIPGDMVLVPQGGFLYGDPKEERFIAYDYEIDVFSVTNRQYKEFVDAAEYEVPDHWDGKKRTYPEGYENHPVVNVTWNDVTSYVLWLTKTRNDGYEYRLPTEEEWEKAASGTDGRTYPWGNDFDESLCNVDESGIGAAVEVTEYPEGSSPYGCRQMSGNVLEWAANGRSDSKTAHKVLRGGCWLNNHDNVFCAYRLDGFPFDRGIFIGFRCVRMCSPISPRSQA